MSGGSLQKCCGFIIVGINHFTECRENPLVTVWEMLINPLKSSTKVVLTLSVGPADYLHKRRTICRVSLKHERTTAQLNCDRQVHTYCMTAWSCGIMDTHAAKIHYCKFSKIAIVGRLWGLHYLLKASIGYQRRLCVFGGRGHRLCVFGGICVDMWRLVHQWSFLLFWQSFNCFGRVVHCWYSLVMLHVFPVTLQETRAT